MADFAGAADAHDRPAAARKPHRRAQICTAAFPEKSAGRDRDASLRGVWDNLGRMGAEFAHLDRLWDCDPEHPDRRGRIDLDQDGIERFVKLR